MFSVENKLGSEEKTVVMSFRVKQKFGNLIKKYCELDGHLNPADLMRDALREKIQRDTPKLYRELFLEEEKY